MKCHMIPVLLITTLLSSCNKSADRRSTPAPNQAKVVQLPASESTSKETSHALGDYVSFPACGIKIRQPEGFEKAASFDGFGNPETQSSVMAVTIAGPYSKATAGFTKEHMKARGWTLQSRQDVKVDGLTGILVHFEQPAEGVVLVKWSLAFGDDKNTTLVTATLPKAHERGLSARLKSAVLSTKLERIAHFDPRVDLPFSITPNQKLKLTPAISKMLTYTKDGVIPTKSPKDPFFIAGTSLGKVAVGDTDKLRFAEQRLRETAQTKRLAVKSTKDITIASLDGYESLAEAEDSESRTPLLVYQVILFDKGSYILMQGLVGTELGDEYLPEFKAMARSLKKNQP